MKIQDVRYVADAHSNYAAKPEKAYRKWDQKTPYHVHPIWCAATISTETKLDRRTREDGVQTLLYHDVVEDTTKPLPKKMPQRIKTLVQDMTFESSDAEMKEIWNKSPQVRLYKLYDKVSNLMDGSWMTSEKRQKYVGYTRRLIKDVEANYGNLNITQIAKAIIGYVGLTPLKSNSESDLRNKLEAGTSSGLEKKKKATKGR